MHSEEEERKLKGHTKIDSMITKSHSDLLREASFPVRRGEALHSHHLPIPLGFLHISKLATLKKLQTGWYERLSQEMSQFLKEGMLAYFYSRGSLLQHRSTLELNTINLCTFVSDS